MFDKKLHIITMQPHAIKLASWLKKYHNISFETQDGILDNVIFSMEHKALKISHHCFYRFSGICKIPKQGVKRNEIEWTDVTDDIYINTYMKSLILSYFNMQI